MATVYIDPDWPNTGAGTFANPYKSWASTATLTAGNSYLQAEGTAGTGDVTSNVGLLNTFYPTSTSSLVEAGTHLSYSVDKAKKQRHNPPTIGAYENTSVRGSR